MRNKLAGLLAVLTATVAGPAWAGEDIAYWQNLQVTIKASDEIRVSSDTSLRSSDARGFYQLQQVTMIGYKPSKKVTLWAGYVHTPQYSRGDFTVMERRFRQQLNVDDVAKIGSLNLGLRVRTEQRWRDGINGTGWRLRPSLRGSVPLTGKLRLNLAHESFINLNTTTFQRQAGYDRMRNSAGIAIPVNKAIGFELGYLNQWSIVRNGPDNVDHIINTTISASF
ncbi:MULTISPECIES: DUF2490 domain-containing protein [unclassified Novosphingobium]|uniref:DUF2490 domain-containing protein n=1 Tax=unclassified Novosphingobium TaxID=2644732 RepID=UPI000EBF6D5B|nr:MULTISPECIES: DUF2490 domain-containing protein [unclassified Novosphingobium]HCF25377.1 DUF2490 domain-containing protein [Novosphingobium sp.]HQV04130.1 DUF2490 domain-containing protein [Novosphingobium sp.]